MMTGQDKGPQEAALHPDFSTGGATEKSGPGLIKPASAEIAFIDAIHMPDVVQQQFATLRPMMKPGGLVLFDDIAFSDGMRRCWEEIAKSSDIAASGTLGRRTGIVEVNQRLPEGKKTLTPCPRNPTRKNNSWISCGTLSSPDVCSHPVHD